MEVNLQRVSEFDKPVLARLLELYLYDMSLYEGAGPGPHGLFGYRWLDSYWTEANRHPFFITADGELAGFALVNDFCRFTEPGAAMAVAEFFVMNRFRRKGVGSQAALKLFRMFPGRWEVCQHRENRPSIEFWENLISDISRGQYRKLEAESEEWTGQALIFSIDSP